MIVDVPSSLYRLKELTQLSLDWFSYLNSEYVGVHTKHMKAKIDSEKCSLEERRESENQGRVIHKFLEMCKLVQVVELKSGLEERMQVMHKNPQQDDYNEASQAQQ